MSDKNYIKGKIAVVTGSSKGIGKEIARSLAAQGAAIIILARGKAALEETYDEFIQQGFKVDRYICDVSNEEMVKNMVVSIMEKYGRIDILVNNAGVGYNGPVEETPGEQFDLITAVDIRGVYNTVKHIIPYMKNQKSGYIVNISSLEGLKTSAGASAYGAAKFGVRGFSQALADEAKPHNIRVSIVYPGSVDTHFQTGVTDEQREKMMKPEDIGNTVMHLLNQPERYWIYEIQMKAFHTTTG